MAAVAAGALAVPFAVVMAVPASAGPFDGGCGSIAHPAAGQACVDCVTQYTLAHQSVAPCTVGVVEPDFPDCDQIAEASARADCVDVHLGGHR